MQKRTYKDGRLQQTTVLGSNNRLTSEVIIAALSDEWKYIQQVQQSLSLPLGSYTMVNLTSRLRRMAEKGLIDRARDERRAPTYRRKPA